MRYLTIKAIAALGGCVFAVSAAACSYSETRLSDERIDTINRENLSTLTDLFEGEIISTDKSNWRLRVGRVFRGSLTSGTILTGPPTFHTCMTTLPKKGDHGVIWIGWGPRGPGFTNAFVDAGTLASLRRIGALPIQ